MKVNQFVLTMDALPQNEAFARTVVASFCLNAQPTLEEISDVKTAVSEAVTNSIVHAYENKGIGKIKIKCKLNKNVLEVEVSDSGKGIEDVEKAKEPFFTTRPEEERSGMGFTVMESFMDSLNIVSELGFGTKVKMTKIFNSNSKEQKFTPTTNKKEVVDYVIARRNC